MAFNISAFKTALRAAYKQGETDTFNNVPAATKRNNVTLGIAQAIAVFFATGTASDASGSSYNGAYSGGAVTISTPPSAITALQNSLISMYQNSEALALDEESTSVEVNDLTAENFANAVDDFYVLCIANLVATGSSGAVTGACTIGPKTLDKPQLKTDILAAYADVSAAILAEGATGEDGLDAISEELGNAFEAFFTSTQIQFSSTTPFITGVCTLT